MFHRRGLLSTVTLLCCLKYSLCYKLLSFQSWAFPWQPFFGEHPGDQATPELFLSQTYSHWFEDGVSSCWRSEHITRKQWLSDGQTSLQGGMGKLLVPTQNLTWQKEAKDRQKRILFLVWCLESLPHSLLVALLSTLIMDDFFLYRVACGWVDDNSSQLCKNCCAWRLCHFWLFRVWWAKVGSI